MQQRLHVEIGLYRDHARIIVLPQPCPQPIQPIDFDHAPELIDHALAESRTYLDCVEQTEAVDGAIGSAERLVARTHTLSADQRVRRDKRCDQRSGSGRVRVGGLMAEERQPTREGAVVGCGAV